MKAKEILSQFKYYKDGHLPRKAIEAAIVQQTEITPHLIEILEDAVNNTQKYLDSQTLMWHIYAVYLLAQFREVKAYPLIVEMLSKPDDIPFDFFGDGVTEDMGRILAAVCHGELSLIQQMIENDDVNEYVRSACFTALLTLYTEGELERQEIIDYFEILFQGKLKKKPHYIWGSLVSSCNHIYADRLVDEIKTAFQDNLIEDAFIDLDYIQNTFNKSKEDVLAWLDTNHHHHFITDTISVMQSWSSFDEPIHQPEKTTKAIKSVKVGRNAPCSCGSGKKYKKCCLH